MLQTAILFKDHMVLQRGKKIAVWGFTDADTQIQVTMQGKSVSVISAADGKWMAVCGPFYTSFQEQMLIETAEEQILLNDVQVGDVWLAGGQSNMEFHMRYDADLKTEKSVCKNDNIRFFDYPEVSYIGQIDEADYGKHYGFWRKAEPEQLERFSAVAYYFAKEIQNKYSIPVGIIGCNWGGTPACAWMSEEAVMNGGGQVYLDEYAEAIRNLDFNEYDRNFRNNPAAWRTDLLGDPVGDMMMSGYTMQEIVETLKKQGIDLAQSDSSAWIPVIGPKYERRPCGLYQSMLKQIVPFTLKGIIWYQGETDGDCHPEVYETLFPALIQNWRQLWNENLPFLFVQIAPLDHWLDCKGEPYVLIREAQQNTVDNVSGTGMAVITDLGMKYDIHPKKKKPVGHRLALLAEHMVYGEDNLCEAPTLSEIQIKDGEMILAFENAGEGLYLAETAPYGQYIGSDHFGGLQVFQDGQEIDENKISISVRGKYVVVAGSEIRAGLPTTVKIACTGWYLVNLYNSAGIPAGPVQKEYSTK